MTATLYSRASEPITLAAALTVCHVHLKGGIALLYSATACQLARVTVPGVLTNAGENPITLEAVFEARIFSETHELRWLHQPGGQGRAVLLAETPLADGFLDQPLDPLPYREALPQQYLVWGKGLDSAEEASWGAIATARIGRLALPCTDIKQDTYVYLHSTEYLGEVDSYGNMAIREERFTILSPQEEPHHATK